MKLTFFLVLTLIMFIANVAAFADFHPTVKILSVTALIGLANVLGYLEATL